MEEVIKALEAYRDKVQREKGLEPAIRFPASKVATTFAGGTQLAIPVNALIEELKLQYKV